jgi:hypothetical protein
MRRVGIAPRILIVVDMEVSGGLHAPVALCPGKDSKTPILEERGESKETSPLPGMESRSSNP